MHNLARILQRVKLLQQHLQLKLSSSAGPGQRHTKPPELHRYHVLKGFSVGASFLAILLGAVNVSQKSHVAFVGLCESERAEGTLTALQKVKSLYSGIEHLTPLLDYDEAEPEPPSTVWPPLQGGNSIRLFRIVNAGMGDTLEVVLSEYAMDDLPTYDALSYCRTTSKGQKAIKCNGSRIEITKSLFDALLALIEHGKTGYLWADALCISQADVNEKNSQVRKLGDIFYAARHVWIHVGGSDISLPTEIETRIHSGLQPESIQSLQMVRWLKFFAQPYFERVWIIQEICYARDANFLYEGHSTPWEVVAGVATGLHSRYVHSGLPFSNTAIKIQNVCHIKELRKQIESLQTRPCLLDLIMKTSRFEASDPRDKLFAIVGLAGDVDAIRDWELFPDYSAPLREVDKRFAMWTLARKGDMRLLSFSPLSSDRSPGLPSWVPELSTSIKANQVSLLAVDDEFEVFDSRLSKLVQNCTPHQCFADGVLRPLYLKNRTSHSQSPVEDLWNNTRKFSFESDNSVLRVRGTVIDKIERLGDPSPFGTTSDESDMFLLVGTTPNSWQQDDVSQFSKFVKTYLSNVADWLRECQQLAQEAYANTSDGKQSSLNEHDMECFWLTLTCNRLHDGRWARGFKDGRIHFDIHKSSEHDAVAEMWCRFGSTLPTIELNKAILPKLREENAQSTVETELRRTWEDSSINIQQNEHFLEKLFDPGMQIFMRSILPAMARWSKGRRFGVTSHQRFANLPLDARAGDMICLVFGATVPYVLRHNYDGTLSLIGECYVQGIMNGGAINGENFDEPFQTYEKSQWQPRTILAIR